MYKIIGDQNIKKKKNISSYLKQNIAHYLAKIKALQ